MTNKELNLQPLQEFLTNEVKLDSLIKNLNSIYYYFTELSMKISCLEEEPIEKEVVMCQYWIARLKQVFEAVES